MTKLVEIIRDRPIITVSDKSVRVVVSGSEGKTVKVENKSPKIVVSEAKETRVVEVGRRGPQGPPGEAVAAGLEITAGIALGGHRMVVVNAAEKAIYADNTNMDHLNSVIGMTIGAVDADAVATVSQWGPIEMTGWSWILDKPVFLSTNGQVTQTIPSTGFILIIGFPMSATKLDIRIQQPIRL